jgi:SAM-dependent methyltransferase
MNLAENLDIGNHVIFIGSVLHAQLIDVFSQAMIFIAPSINTKDDVEGLPNVILEAIAAKVPVITTDAGGITDIIEHNVTGVLVQQGRSDQLAKSVIELIRNHELRAALAENAYQKLLTNYTYSEMGKKYREVILKTLRGNDQRSKMHNKWHQTPSHILRKGCIEYVIRDWTPSPFIEFGAGTGDITKSFLQKGFFGICYDLGEENRNVLRRNLAQYQGKVEVIDDIESLKGRSFDYLFAFEVLEHIQNDDEVLSLWSPYLKARGKILISVPAHAKKYSKEDERVGHLRRYEKEGLYALLERAGYSNIHILNYGFPIGNMTRIVSKFLGGTDHSWDRLSSEERSIKSGIERLEIINRLSFFFNNVTLFPFILTQKIFFKKDWGEGYVAFAEKK